MFWTDARQENAVTMRKLLEKPLKPNETSSKTPPDYHIFVTMQFPSGLIRPISPSFSMTLRLLIDRRVCSEYQVAEEGAQSNSDHDPAVVSHENQPKAGTAHVSIRLDGCAPGGGGLTQQSCGE